MNKTVNGEVYYDMLNDHAIPSMNRMGKISDFWWMQDGARPHRTSKIFGLLDQHFGERIISLDANKYNKSGIDWPAYSPDLNPCDFFLWGYLKDTIYKNPIQTIDDLVREIERQICGITPDLLKKALENFEKRLDRVIETDGKHFENLYY